MPELSTVQEFSSVRDLITAVMHRGVTAVKLRLPQEVKDNPKELEHDIKLLAAFFRREKCNITSLDISGNNIGASGGRAIREALPYNHTLQHLDISHNQLGSREVGLLAGSLSNNKTISHLSVAGNIPHSSKEKAFSEAMLGELVKTNSTLRTLNISQNNLGEGDLFRNAILENDAIHTLNIADNGFTPKNADACNSKVRANRDLAPLRIIHNAIISPNISTEQVRVDTISKAQKLASPSTYKAFLHTPNKEGRTPLQEIMAHHTGTAAVRLIQTTLAALPEQEQTALLQQTNAKGENLLHDAARKGDTEIAKFLIGKGVDATVRSADTHSGTKFINMVRGKGSSPADLARASGNHALAEMLQRTKNQQQGRQGGVER